MQALFATNSTNECSLQENTWATLDARARMFVSFLASIVTILISSYEGQLILFVASLGYVLSIKRYKTIGIAYCFMALMVCLATFFTWILSLVSSSMPFSLGGVIIPFLRGAVMMNVVLPLALTCRIQELLTALKGMKLPFCIYIPGAVMIRFIPTFINDVKQVVETLKIRGYSLSFREMFFHPLFMLRLMFTPILFRALRTSEELGMAGELKGLDATSKFIPYKKREWKQKDTMLIVLAIIISCIALYVHYSFGTVVKGGM